MKRSIVKIIDESNGDAVDSFESSDELGSGEPLTKRRRFDKLGDNSSSDESSIDSTIEVKKKYIDNQSTLLESLAQTIVNTNCVANENPSFSAAFTPSFIATNRKVRISMYNCNRDVPLLSGELDIFEGHSFIFFLQFS